MKRIPLLSAALALAIVLSAHGQDKSTLVLAKTNLIPHVQGGFNHMSSDAGHGLLFVTATAKKTVEIVDVKAGKPLRSLTGEGPAAVLFAPEFNQLYTSRRQRLCIYDGTHFDLMTSVELPSTLDEL